jgi:hypothetical protein
VESGGFGEEKSVMSHDYLRGTVSDSRAAPETLKQRVGTITRFFQISQKMIVRVNWSRPVPRPKPDQIFSQWLPGEDDSFHIQSAAPMISEWRKRRYCFP